MLSAQRGNSVLQIKVKRTLSNTYYEKINLKEECKAGAFKSNSI